MEQNRSLVKKMAEIMTKVKYIQKTGYNAHNKYTYVTEQDVLEALREEMAARNLMIFQELEEITVTSGETSKGKGKNLTTIKMKYTICDGDSGEERVISQGGQGEDTGDKGVYKATTGANKYALLKLFMIPTGDDPENDGGVHPDQWAGNQQQGGSAPPQQMGQAQQQDNAPSAADVDHLRRSLGWEPDQMLSNLNVWLAKNNHNPVSKWKDLEPVFKAAFYKVMLNRLDKILNGGK